MNMLSTENGNKSSWTNLASITTDICPVGPILANHYSEVQFNLFFLMNHEPFDVTN